ncbi:MAG: ABC transporter permease, partial [Acidimicrobiia bacterium]|nr:ABC transporter permease [Acidimicrobiia bacterium]
ASLAALAMAAAVATSAAVQTGLDGLARSARDASARAFGSDAFVLTRVAAGTLSRRELRDRLVRNPNITRGDVRFLEGVADGRVQYAATAQRPADVSAGGRTFENAAINGTQAALFAIREVGLEQGRPFTEAEEQAAAQVIVAGRAIVDELFPAADPLGRQVRIAGRAFRIVGVQTRQGTTGGVTLDRYVWMPVAAFERAFGAAPSLQVFAAATGPSRTRAAEDRARISMRARRQLGPAADDTFDLITPEASRTFVDAITSQVGAAGPPIAFMALIAAIVVVANTTLVSVAQRTREIGIRRAVGAARVHVLAETLAESTVIALVGGVAGLAAAAAALSLAAAVVDIPLSLEWPTALGSLAAAAASGMVAGWYPARRAAGIEVMAALRQE